MHTLSILYALISELVRVEQPEPKSDSSSDSEDDDEEDLARARELGLEAVKAAYANMMAGTAPGLVKGGEVVSILWEKMRNISGSADFPLFSLIMCNTDVSLKGSNSVRDIPYSPAPLRFTLCQNAPCMDHHGPPSRPI